ncbi:response regulator [Nostoc sp. NIES-2111]
MAQAVAADRYALVVEDDAGVRELAALLFEECGLQVLETDTAEGALEHIDRHGAAIQFLFVDIRLAGTLDGVDLARTVSRLWPETKVIVTSGLPPLEPLPEDAIFMQKPWRALDLIIETEKKAA